MKCIWRSAALILLAVCADTAVGQTVSGVAPLCGALENEVVTAPKPAAPSLVNATLSRYPQIAFRICNDRNGSHYFMRAPEPTTNEVCIFYEVEVFSPVDPLVADQSFVDARSSKVSWQFPPKPWSTTPIQGQRPQNRQNSPSEYMIETANSCPPLDNADYVKVEKISAGAFKAVSEFWRDLMSSESKMDSAIAHLADARRCDPVLAIRPRSEASDLDRFAMSIRDAIFGNHHSPKIWSIDLRWDGLGYSLLMQDSMTNGYFWAVVDFTAAGAVQLQCLAPVHQI